MSAALPDAWRELALSPPRACGPALCSGHIRQSPEDFLVEEILGFEPDGDGSHVLLQIRKRDCNTEWVARQLARVAQARNHDVGYAGLKDRHALTTQWFSVPRGSRSPAGGDWLGHHGEGYEVLAAHAHRRKLPRGALAGNRFEIVIRDCQGDATAVLARLQLLAQHGVPNYFGPQRFGHAAANLRELPRAGRGFAISAARSLVFNAVLAARIAQGSWATLQSGDCANLDGRGSFFLVGECGPDSPAALQPRLAALDVHPTGPMWGSGTLSSGAAVRELEQATAAAFAEPCAALESLGLNQERRSLRVALRDAVGAFEPVADIGVQLRLRFTLRSGAFATTVLRELGDFDVPQFLNGDSS